MNEWLYDRKEGDQIIAKERPRGAFERQMFRGCSYALAWRPRISGRDLAVEHPVGTPVSSSPDAR